MSGADSEGIVAKNVIRQTVVAESLPQNVPGGFHGDVQTGPQSDDESGMIVDRGEWKNATPLNFNGTLEIALPELTGKRAFEELIGDDGRRRQFDASVASKNIGNGTNRRKRQTVRGKVGPDLTRPPAKAITNIKQSEFKFRRRGVGRGPRPGRTILKRVMSGALQPFVTGLAADAKQAASGGNRKIADYNLMDKSDAAIDHGNTYTFPRHANLLFRGRYS